MHILFILFVLLFGFGVLQGLLGRRVTLFRRGVPRRPRSRRDPLSPGELHRFHQVYGTPGW